MSFNRITYYKKEANKFIGEELTINELAIKLKETCPKAWIKVRNNNFRVYKGEIRLENVNPYTHEPDPNSIWMYRPNDNYDSVLFSKLFLQFIPVIYNNYKSIYNIVDEDEYLDYMEYCLCQCIRHFDIEKNCSFKTFTINMLKQLTINCVNKYSTCHKVKNEDGSISDQHEYHDKPLSLEKLHEIGVDFADNNIKSESLNIVNILKEKCLQHNDILSWLICDLCLDNSSILGNKKFIFEQKTHNNQFNILSPCLIESVINNVVDNNLYLDYGFKNSNLVQEFKKISIKNISFKEKKKAKHSLYNKFYKKSVDFLKQNMNEYRLGVI